MLPVFALRYLSFKKKKKIKTIKLKDSTVSGLFGQPVAQDSIILARLFSLVGYTHSQAKPNPHLFV